MPTLAWRARVRNEANTADLVTWTMDDLAAPPSGDGTEVDLATGRVRSGSYTVDLADRLITGTERTGTRWFADAGGRFRLLSRRAFVERSVDGGAWSIMFAGYITRVALPDAATVRVQIGEAPRVPATARAFSIATASAIRGAIIGGPLTADWGPLKTVAGWTMVVTAVGGSISSQLVTLQPTRGSVAPSFVAGPVTPAMIAQVNTLAVDAVAARSAAYAEEPTDVRGNQFKAYRVPLLSATLTPLSGSPVTATPVVVGLSYNTVGFGFVQQADAPVQLIRTDGTAPAFSVDWPGTLPTVGAVYTVRVVSVSPTAFSPVYYDAHPLTIAEELYTAAGVAIDTASFAAARDQIGAQVRLALRVTEPTALQPWLEQNISGPLGVTFLPDTQGRIAAKASRFQLTALPSDTIALSNVSAIGSVWEIEEGSAIARVSWSQVQFIPAADERAVDGVLAQRQTVGYDIGDQTTFANATLEYDVDGMYHTAGTWQADTSILGGGQIAAIASRYARGAPTTELTLVRGTSTVDALTLGDYRQVDIPSLPVGNVRRGDLPGSTSPRVMQALRITERAATREVLFEDAGPANNPGTTAPTLSVSISTVAGVSTAFLTVTNAATLNAIPVGVGGEIAFTSGAAPAAADWSFYFFYLLGQAPTVAVAYPLQLRDTTVWFRARSFNPQLFLPSAYSTAVSASVGALPAPTSLAAASVAGSGAQLTLTWTRATLDGAVFDIEARTGSNPFTPRLTAAAQSTSAVIGDLVASTAHDVRVRARIVATGAISAWATASGTTSGASATVAAPTLVQVASDGQGTFRVMGVVAGDPLPLLQAESAPETGVGAGTYGTFEPIGQATPDATGMASVSASAPRDGLRRRLRVRAVSQTGASSYVTATPDVTPYVVQQAVPPGTGGAAPRFTSTTVTVPTSGAAPLNITLAWVTADAPAGFTVGFTGFVDGVATDRRGITSGVTLTQGRTTSGSPYLVDFTIGGSGNPLRGTLTMYDSAGNALASRAITTTSYFGA